MLDAFAELSTPLVADACARLIRPGETLRRQTAFDEYLVRRADDPSYTFRLHLRGIGGAIEE